VGIAILKCRTDVEDLYSELDSVMQHGQLNAMFQPIVDIHAQQILGYEALIRGPSDSSLHSPITLFETGHGHGCLSELDLLCRKVSIKQFNKLALPGKLFLNTCPSVLLAEDHPTGETLTTLLQLGISPDDIVIELTEQFPLDDYKVMREALFHYRAMGFRIAIDDLGAGYAGLRMWSELRPDYVKIDRHFIQNINEDAIKKEFVRSIIDIARGLECRVIAEGIENELEYQTICSLGIKYGQGYYFARPQLQPVHQLPASLFTKAYRRSGRAVRLSETVSSLRRDAPMVTMTTATSKVVEIFKATPHLLSIPVVEKNNIARGMVRRYRLMDVFASQYGRDLYSKKPISQLMDQAPVIVEEDMSVEKVSQFVTDSAQMHIEDDFIITRKGAYAGIGSVLDLLKKITDLQVRNARYANPLTMLPGNVPIYEFIDDLLSRQEGFAVAYCDLDHFKPYNDVYGYGRGDQILQQVAEILTSHVNPEMDFVGHVGGDDFILVFCSQDWQQRCEAMILQFDNEIPLFYTAEDQERQGIVAFDRRGESVFFPMLSLSIGLVIPDLQACHSHHDVAAMASEAKCQAKGVTGSVVFVDRRKLPV